MASPSAVINALSEVAERTPAGGPRARVAVVTSALSGVTDRLVRWVDRQDRSAGVGDRLLAELRDLHWRHLGELAWGDSERLATARLGLLLDRLARLSSQTRAAGCGARVEMLATGERMAAVVFWAALSSRGLAAQVVDPGELLAAEGSLEDAAPDVPGSRRRTAIRLGRGGPRRLVVPGFFARGRDGALRLLGRGGSDTAASLLGAALDATQVEIWTDVAGVYPSDPRQNPRLEPFPHLSFDAAEDLARAGAKVLHPRSVAPARAAGVPLWVRNSERPELPGTWIGAAP